MALQEGKTSSGGGWRKSPKVLEVAKNIVDLANELDPVNVAGKRKKHSLNSILNDSLLFYHKHLEEKKRRRDMSRRIISGDMQLKPETV